MQRLLTTAILVGLLVATAAAFAVTERLKLTKSPLTKGTRVSKVLSPTCGCSRGKATILIKLRQADDVTVRIVDGGKNTVRLLVDGVHASRGVNVFRWDGHTDGNAVAPDGTYQAEVHLARAHQTILLPNRILLDTSKPEVKKVSVNRSTFSPDGDGQSDYVRFRYELSKPAHVVLFLNGKRILYTKRHPRSGTFTWSGNAQGVKLPQGWYTLEVGALDAAGNSTPVAKRQAVHVHLRYIALASRRIVVRAGTRFAVGVSTDAKRYGWKLGRRKSVASGSVLTLRASTVRGRYTLTVSERGHAAHATVLVR